MATKRACLIGAGSSGIAAAKALRERGGDIAADHAAMRARYASSKRHTIQVDFDDYLYALAKERRAGVARARARGYSPPILCRPSAVTTAS
ncbi:MAG TPA: hypothetical protein VFI66_00565 [Gemmatimonadales bacterium]|nr:hypothetical protein [Gemmatimonadales bacterium]